MEKDPVTAMEASCAATGLRITARTYVSPRLSQVRNPNSTAGSHRRRVEDKPGTAPRGEENAQSVCCWPVAL